jgi:hypothetical protein
VFSDVDLAGTSMAFATTAGILGPLPVLTFTGNQTFSFLGVFLGPGEELITSATIVTGTTALGPSESPGVDLVVMDDFLYGEPQGVPQPRSMLLLGLGLRQGRSLPRERLARSRTPHTKRRGRPRYAVRIFGRRWQARAARWSLWPPAWRARQGECAAKAIAPPTRGQ